jgi:hypothetical protein
VVSSVQQERRMNTTHTQRSVRLIAALALIAAGCLTSTDTGPTSPGPGSPNNNNPTPEHPTVPEVDAGAPAVVPDLMGVPAMDVQGAIAADTTWSGVINVKAAVTVGAGKTLTVQAGTVVTVTAGAGLTVMGSLKVMGTAQAQVLFNPTATSSTWNGIIIGSGGSGDIAYATIDTTTTSVTCSAGAVLCTVDHSLLNHFTAASMTFQAAGTLSYSKADNGGANADGLISTAPAGALVTVTNSIFHLIGHDALVVGSGDFTASFNRVAGDVKNGGTGLHCGMHIDTIGTVTIDHNDFYNDVYGMMLSNGSSTSKVTNNNFYDNQVQWGATGGNGVNPAADLTNNYWGGGPPPAIGGNSKTTPYASNLIGGTGPQ